jgi:hypothetical protein
MLDVDNCTWLTTWLKRSLHHAIGVGSIMEDRICYFSNESHDRTVSGLGIIQPRSTTRSLT